MIAAHHVAEREENSAEDQHEQEQADNMPALQHAVSPIAATTSNCHLRPRTSERFHPATNNIDGERKHNRCVLFDTYFSKGLKIT